ncbi:Cbb3-type cytochrome c oxidase subunit CcoP2 [Poriferisphaera corsica]|uniref:Cbb3-type cytochrome c oxidase subunit CcoP2 n=1 Tax=Poriferisphaera corsica TaxID=2528020 RepID=A0A517YPF0_9BACT|nr:cbb3-type cytochrome c oxidase N-terminal domain-containing protein [Poriferisphaera corsica]QDU32100.1 Cbb3-type cytochrome c oxidase subunit CcoP2 [Poriferisphaera corsica]
MAEDKKKEIDNLTDHNYDGIMEYDNPLPGWWVWLFWGTIVFSIIYFFIVTMAQGELSPLGELRREKAMWQERKLAVLGEMAPSEETMLRLMSEPAMLEQGRSLYVGKCAVCHGQNGEGIVGPNLTDDRYRNVKTLMDVFKVVKDGAGGGSMPAWKTQMMESDMLLVSAYTASLRGEDLPGKTPEAADVEIAPWPKAEEK